LYEYIFIFIRQKRQLHEAKMK